jgi:antitoxin ParD1/3/4
MIIHLTPDQEQFIQSKLQAGQYANTEEIIQVAFRLLAECDEFDPAWLETVREKVDQAYETTEASVDGSTFINQLRQRIKSQHTQA